METVSAGRRQFRLRMALFALMFSMRIAAQAQDSPLTGLSGLNPLGDHEGGIHLYNASVFGAYYSGGLPGMYGQSSYNSLLLDDGMIGASASIGWRKSSERTRFSGTYSASYMSQFQYSQLSGFSQSLGLQFSRKLGARWSFDLVTSAGVRNAEASIFSPTAYASLASAPSTFDALTQVVASGNLNNNQIASLLTGAPILSSPAQTLVFGSQYFYSSAQTSLTYTRSSRLSLTFTGGGSRIEHLNDSTRDATYAYILPQSTDFSAGMSLGYSLTPRTQMSVSVGEARVVSALFDSYNTGSNVSFTRNMSMHWFLEGHVGAAQMRVLHETYALPKGVQYITGGSLGYKLYGSTLVASYQRFLGDAYGLGASSTLDFHGSWHWNKPGASWGLNVSGGMQRLQLVSSTAVNTWMAMGGLTRQFTSHLSLQMQYGFNSYAGYYGTLYNRTQNAAQVSLAWTPHPILKIPSKL